MIIKPYIDKKLGVKFWRYDGWIDGKRRRRKGFSSRDAAKDAAAKARTLVTERKAGIVHAAPTALTAKQVIEKHIIGIRAIKGERGYMSRARARVNLRTFLSTLPEGLLITEIKTAHLADFRDARLLAVQPQTVFRELNDILACLNNAWEKFPELESWRPPKRPKIDAPHGEREVVFNPADIERLLNYLRRPRETEHSYFHAGEPLRAYRARLDAADYFQMALQTSKRAGEIRTRAWADVLWHDNALRVEMTKTNKTGVIYLPESLMQLLRERKENQNPPSRWIFPSDRNPERPMFALNVKLIRRACRDIGIEWGYDSPGGVVFHTTRHTATTAMFEEGFDPKLVQSQTGHSDSAMARRYNHPKAEKRREVAQALDRFAVSVSVPTSAPPSPDMPHNPHGGHKKMPRKRGKK